LKTITIRKIPPELADRIEEYAEREGTSLAQAVIRLLLRATGLSPDGVRRKRWTDLDELAGTWRADEADAFDRALADQRPIDPDLWR
jgi:hypothetical protein